MHPRGGEDGGQAVTGPLARITAASFVRLPARTPGSYLLLVRLRTAVTFAAGRLPSRCYLPGWYVYAGSAMSGLKVRLLRYLDPGRKRHWHVDYLLEHGAVVAAWVVTGREPLECRLAAALGETLAIVPRFGSSDCRCGGHLFYASRRDMVTAAVGRFVRGSFQAVPAEM
jgi:Uri superfamily endonuclease